MHSSLIFTHFCYEHGPFMYFDVCWYIILNTWQLTNTSLKKNDNKRDLTFKEKVLITRYDKNFFKGYIWFSNSIFYFQTCQIDEIECSFLEIWWCTSKGYLYKVSYPFYRQSGTLNCPNMLLKVSQKFPKHWQLL